MEQDISVLTLNCCVPDGEYRLLENHTSQTSEVSCFTDWGVVPYVTRKTERLAAIRKELSAGKYDLICLQEIWSETDYCLFKEALKEKYPYENYYHSNYIGSGCCIFSKFKIIDTFFFRYSVNGYAHRLFHGDWFGGKGLGLAKLELPKGFRLNVYITHLHADYAELGARDCYLAHRCSQSLEMLHFVRLSLDGCDAALLTGDMNSTPDSITYEMITQYGGFKDAYLVQPSPPANPEVEGATCDRPDNSYTPPRLLLKRPHGLRLDYIFFLNNAGSRINCQKCELAVRKMDKSTFNFSDHEGVYGQFNIKRHVMEPPSVPSLSAARSCLRQCRNVIESGLQRCDTVRFYCKAVLAGLVASLFMGVCFLVEESGSRVPLVPLPVINFSLASLGISCFALLWHTVIIRAAERKAFLNNLQTLRFMENAAKDGAEAESNAVTEGEGSADK